jgi:hypothetical protein
MHNIGVYVRERESVGVFVCGCTGECQVRYAVCVYRGSVRYSIMYVCTGGVSGAVKCMCVQGECQVQ